MRNIVFFVISCIVFTIASSSHTYCQYPRPQICTLEYNPVCGTKFNGQQQTYGNSCGACSDPQVISWIAGACQTNPPPGGNPGFVTCTYIPGRVCIQIYDPVCATYWDGTRRTLGNACTACTDPRVRGYTAGACSSDPVPPPPQPPPSGRLTFCPPGPRQQLCTREYVATCGFKYNGSSQDYGNTCTACADVNVFGYIIGQCATSVTTCPDNRNRPQICTEIYMPVCGLLRNRTTRTFSNSCQACSERNVVSYTNGACQ